MAHQLNGAQLAALLQHWNHPVIKPFLLTAAGSIGSVVLYQKGKEMDWKMINHNLARFAAPELMLGPYVPHNKVVEYGPNHPSIDIFGRPEPELISAARITARTSSPELGVILERFSTNQSDVAYHTITAAPALASAASGTHSLDALQQPQTSYSALGVMGLAAVAATIAIFAAKMSRKSRGPQKPTLNDAEMIAHLMLELKKVNVAKEAITTELEAAKKQVSCTHGGSPVSEEEGDQLQKRVTELVTEYHNVIMVLVALRRSVKEAGKARDETAKLVQATVERLEAQVETSNDRVKKLETDNAQLEYLRKLAATTSIGFHEKFREAQKKLAELRAEKDDCNRDLNAHLQAVQTEKDDLSRGVHLANFEKMQVEKQLKLFSEEQEKQLKSISEKHEKRLKHAMDSAHQAWEQKIAELEAARENAEAQVKEKDDKIKKLGTDCGNADRALQEKVAEMKEVHEQFEAQLQEKHAEMEAAREQFEAQLTEKDSRLEKLGLNASEAIQEKIAEIKADRANFEAQLKNKDEKLRELGAGYQSATATYDDLTAELTLQLDTLRQERDQAIEAAHEERRKMIYEKDFIIDEKDAIIKEAQRQNTELTRKVEQLESTLRQQSVEQKSEREAMKGKIEELEERQSQSSTMHMDAIASLEKKMGQYITKLQEDLSKLSEAKAVDERRCDDYKQKYVAMEATLKDTQEKFSISEEKLAQLQSKAADDEPKSVMPKDDRSDDDDDKVDNNNDHANGGGSRIKKDVSTMSSATGQQDGSQQQDRSNDKRERSSDSSSPAPHNTATKAIFSIDNSIDKKSLSRKQQQKFRGDIAKRFQERLEKEKLPHPNAIIQVDLPSRDPYYHGLYFVRPSPIQTLPDAVPGTKPTHRQCDDCHDIFTYDDCQDHQPTCKVFFDHHTYCPGCDNFFATTPAFVAQHWYKCNPERRKGPPENRLFSRSSGFASSTPTFKPDGDVKMSPPGYNVTSRGLAASTYGPPSPSSGRLSMGGKASSGSPQTSTSRGNGRRQGREQFRNPPQDGWGDSVNNYQQVYKKA